MKKPKVAFICVHNSCRSQIAEALSKHFAADMFECFSAGTQLKDRINSDAIRLLKQIYHIDIAQTQAPKLIQDIPAVDFVITMGCQVTCPILAGQFHQDWGLADPTGKSDEEFILVMEQIKLKIIELTNLIAKQANAELTRVQRKNYQ